MNFRLIAFVTLALMIGAGLGYSISLSQISILQSKMSSLESEISTLTTDYSNLNTTYNNLKEDYRNLNDSYNQLMINYTILEQMVNYEVYVLKDEEYYYSIMDDIKEANETVLIAMYSMIYDPDDTFDWANDLIEELVYAKQRGVNVTVIIEYRTYWGYMDENLEAYSYLSANNVNVQLDNDTDTDHMKLVVIDDNIVYVGSHNWSESGLYYNREISVKIIAKEIAELFKAYFETI